MHQGLYRNSGTHLFQPEVITFKTYFKYTQKSPCLVYCHSLRAQLKSFIEEIANEKFIILKLQ